MALDKARIERDQQKIERTLERNQDAMRKATRKSEEYGRTLATSGAEVRTARSDLRKLGFLKEK